MSRPRPQEAASQLLESDYVLLSLEPRLALLRCLTDFAFVSELARAHLDARNEAFAQSRTLGKPGFAATTFSSTPGPAVHGFDGSRAGLQEGVVTPEEAGKQAAAAAAEHATAVRMLEEWVDWVEVLRWGRGAGLGGAFKLDGQLLWRVLSVSKVLHTAVASGL